jgi:hypothetical protein
MYENYKADVTTEYDIDSGHCIPTVDYGIECSDNGSPYLNKCDFYGVQHMLEKVLGGNLNPPGTAKPSNIHEFD